MEDNDATDEAGKAELRRTRRRQVLKRGQVIFGIGDSTIDCLILDEAASGVQLETAVITQFPEQLRLRFSDGATYAARRQWSAGSKIGLEFVGSRLYDEATLNKRKAAREVLKTHGVHAAVKRLQELDFFKDPALREAAEAAELAFARLNALLE
jgi:hypothetical protein